MASCRPGTAPAKATSTTTSPTTTTTTLPLSFTHDPSPRVPPDWRRALVCLVPRPNRASGPWPSARAVRAAAVGGEAAALDLGQSPHLLGVPATRPFYLPPPRFLPFLSLLSASSRAAEGSATFAARGSPRSFEVPALCVREYKRDGRTAHALWLVPFAGGLAHNNAPPR